MESRRCTRYKLLNPNETVGRSLSTTIIPVETSIRLRTLDPRILLHDNAQVALSVKQTLLEFECLSKKTLKTKSLP